MGYKAANTWPGMTVIGGGMIMSQIFRMRRLVALFFDEVIV